MLNDFETNRQTLPIGWNTVVMQPTSLCNLNCQYCYLPDRQEKRFVRMDVVQKVADSISQQKYKINVLWHGGEPLAAGISRMRQAVAPFSGLLNSERCTHGLQTNATLINDEWCGFFKENRFSVGVSIDGNANHTRARVTWSNTPAFDDAIRGIQVLKRHEITFGIIAVVNANNIHEPEAFYEFLCSLCPRSISINVEESEGFNVGKSSLSRSQVDEFWRRLFEAWRRNPVVPIRHFRDSLIVMNGMLDDLTPQIPFQRNIYPTIDTDGNVVVLSPEFIAASKFEREKFIVGNILEDDLDSIIKRATQAWYVTDFFLGVDKCREQCAFFAFCRGGHASNKYFEKGRLDITETNYCYNSRIAPAKAILDALKSGQPRVVKEKIHE